MRFPIPRGSRWARRRLSSPELSRLGALFRRSVLNTCPLVSLRRELPAALFVSTSLLVAGFRARFAPPSPFPTALVVYPSSGFSVCFNRSRSWGLIASVHDHLASPEIHWPEGRRISVSRPASRSSSRIRGRRGGLASVAFPASWETRHCAIVWGLFSPVGPALRREISPTT